MASARANAARFRTLVDEKFISAAQAQQHEDALLEQQARWQNLLRSRSALQRDIDSARRELAAGDLKAHNQRGAIEREIAALEQERTELESRRTVVITSPADGVATAILTERGQSVAAQAALLSIVPGGAQLQAELMVPSRARGFLVPGQTVALRYQAFPYERFGSHPGRITEISQTLIAPGETALPVALPEPSYRVTVALHAQSVKAYGAQVPLQPGMLLEADIWLDHRRIVEWIFDPLLSVAKKV